MTWKIKGECLERIVDKLTEVIRHHIPEIEVPVHFPDVKFLVVGWATWGSDLHQPFKK
jgi:hypothetical protein